MRKIEQINESVAPRGGFQKVSTAVRVRSVKIKQVDPIMTRFSSLTSSVCARCSIKSFAFFSSEAHAGQIQLNYIS